MEKNINHIRRGMRRTLSALLAVLLALSLMISAIPAFTEDAEAESEEISDCSDEIDSAEEADTAAEAEETFSMQPADEAEDGAIQTYADGEDAEDGAIQTYADGEDAEDDSISTYADGDEVAFAVYSADDNSLAFYYDTKPEVDSTYKDKTVTEVYTGFVTGSFSPHSDSNNQITGSSAPWDDKKKDIQSVSFDESFSGVQPASTAYWFFRFENAEAVTGLEYLDTSKVTSMRFMFHYCSAVDTLNVSGFDTSNVTDMSRTFCGCSGLTKLDLSSFNTAKVADMSYMFSSCTGLESLTFGETFDTSAVTTTYCMFADCRSLAKLDVSGFDTSSVTDMTSMFLHCANLTELDVSSFDTSSVTTMHRMFCNCPKLQKISFGSDFNTARVTDMRSMFYNCESLKELDLSGFNTKNVTEYEYFALDCSELAQITIGSDFDLFSKSEKELVSEQYWVDETGEVVSENHLIGVSEPGTYYAAEREFAIYSEDDSSLSFYYVNDPTQFPELGDEYNQKTVTDIYVGFDDSVFEFDRDVPWHSVREKVASVTFDASFLAVQPISLAYWFYGFENVTSFDFIGLDTGEVTDMSYLFYDCFCLKELDLSRFETEKVTECEYFATNCPELAVITIGSGFDLFAKSESALVSEQYWLDENGVVASTHHMIGVSEPGTYYAADGPTAFAVYSADDQSLVFYYDGDVPPDVPGVGDKYNGKTATDVYVGFDDSHYTADHEVPWHDVREAVQSVSFDASFAAVQPIATEYWFYDFASVTSLDFTYLNTGAVTKYDHFAEGCASLRTITIGSGFDLFAKSEGALVPQQYWMDEADNIQSENYMIGISVPGTYYATEELASAAFAIYSTDDSNLIFYRDENLKYAPAVRYDGRTVSGVYTGFENADYTEETPAPWYAVREDVKGVSFDASFEDVQPTSMAYWFYRFTNAESFDLSNLDTSECTSMYCTFEYCESVKKLDLSGLDTGKVTTMLGMLRDCESLVSVDVSGLDVRNVTTMNTMFRDCISLEKIDFTGWETSSIENLGQLLQGCASLTEVDLSMFDVSHATALANIFNGCTNLVTVNVCNWDTSKATGMASTFASCSKLKTIYASGYTWDLGKVNNITNTFNNCANLVGGAGTKWSANHITGDMAHIDTADDPGYFTLLHTVDLSGEITWDDADNQDGVRPKSVTAQLFAQDQDGGTLETWDFELPSYDAGGNEIWAWSIEGLAEDYADGKINYSVIYTGVDGNNYSQTNDGLNTTYTHNPETTAISGSKTWVDSDNAYDTRPASITIRLHADETGAEYEQTVTAKDGWSWTFDEIPVYSDGRLITYTLSEDAVEDYVAAYNGFDAENTLHEGETGVTVIKDWDDGDDQDGLRPEEVIVELLADGTPTGETLTLSESNHWEGVFEVPEYENGVRIDYTVREISTDGYESEITGDAVTGFVIANTHEPEQIDITGQVVWEDADDQDGMRPDSVTAELLANGEICADTETSAENDWTFEFTNLDKYKNGREIEYTVREKMPDEATAAAYETAISGDIKSGFTIVNTHEPELLNGDGTLTVVKVWDDDDDRDGLRPNRITVTLQGNGEDVKPAKLCVANNWWQSLIAFFRSDETVEVNDEGNWEYTFRGLPKYENGVEIEYTVVENPVAEYTTAVTGEAAVGFTITNTHEIETVTVSGRKTWDDADNQDGKRPVLIQINLLADRNPALDENGNVISAVVNEDAEWQWQFDGLPKYRDGGKEIAYTVTEEEVADYETEIYGYDVINRHTPELFNGDGTFRVVIVWDDESDNDGIRPSEVTVTLTADNEKADDAVLTLTAAETDEDGNWTAVFTNLPKYADGKEITYSVKEELRSGYTYRIERLTDENGNAYVQLTNVHVSVTETVEVTKVWDDADNQDGKRPEFITLRLLANGSLYKEINLTEETEGVTISENGNVWKYTMRNIPVDKNGEPIEYTINEGTMEYYRSEILTSRGAEITDNGVTYQPYAFTVTNSHEPEQIDISGRVAWKDADDQDGLRPQYVTVTLRADDQVIEAADVTAAGDWLYCFTELDQYRGGEKIAYTVTFSAADGYTAQADGYDVTYRHTPETTTISGSKTWVDDNNAEGTRPGSITVRLHANGNEKVYVQTVTAADGWNWTFEDVPVYSAGQKIVYTLTEDAADNYDTEYVFGENGSLDVTNTLDPGSTSVTVEKDWEDKEDQDGIRPDEITAELLADGAPTGRTLTLSEENHWEGTFTDLAIYKDGVRIVYSVKEIGVTGYESTVSGSAVEGYLITNTHEPATVSISGEKIWEDNGDQDGKRPETVTIHLLADGEAVQSHDITAEDDWKWTFADLDKYANGREISYTAAETYTADGYEVSCFDDGSQIINTHIPEKTDIAGTVTWDDDDNRDGIRPEQVTVYLIADGKPVTDADGEPVSTFVRADADGSWRFIFSGLDKYANGTEISYTVTEDVPDGYRESDSYFGCDIINIHEPELLNGDGALDVIMYWEDSGNQDGLRPKRTTITLTVNGIPDETVTIVLSDENMDGDGHWIGTFTDLYRYADGAEIAYNVEEGVMNGYTYEAKLAFDADSGRYFIEITNTHAAVTSDITVTKVWDDGDNQDGKRPSNVIFNLFSNGSAVKSVTITPDKAGVAVSEDGNAWSYTFADMPVDQNGEPILYTLDEVDVGSYSHKIETVTAEGQEKDGVTYTSYAFTVTNTHVPATTEVRGEKIWDDADDQDGLRPNSITVELIADGEPARDETGAVVTSDVWPDANGSWAWCFTELPKYRDGGVEIRYTFEEFAVEGYETSYSADGRTVTNVHIPETTSISGNKVWDDADNQDGVRPDGMTVNLYANGLIRESKYVTGADGWEWTFENLPVYANGQKITYVTTETAIDDYDTTYSGFTLTNAYEPGKTSVTVAVVWDDANNQDGLRPSELTAELYADGVPTGNTLTLTEDEESGAWEGTFEHLDEYRSGTRITYSVAADAADGYTIELNGDAQTGYVMICTHIPETTEIHISITWDDEEDLHGIRPYSVIIRLYANGEEVAYHVVTNAENWTWDFTDLPMYANGEKIVYTFDLELPDHEDSYEIETEEDGTVIIHYHDEEEPGEEEPGEEEPGEEEPGEEEPGEEEPGEEEPAEEEPAEDDSPAPEKDEDEDDSENDENDGKVATDENDSNGKSSGPDGAASETASPKTSDDSLPFLAFGLLIMAAAAIVVLTLTGRKKAYAGKRMN